MSRFADARSRPAWLRESDELAHVPADVPLWSESYMSYVYSAEAGIGVWIHLGYKPGSPGLWEETLVIALPGERYLVSRGFSARPLDRDIEICGVSWRCEQAFARWTQRFRGAVQSVGSAELRSGALRDGIYVPVDLELECRAISPANDYGHHVDTSSAWGNGGHYEQHHEAVGHLSFEGQRFELRGTGWRDHSWGPRDLRKFGSHTWLSAQFPQSGRCLMAVHLRSPQPREPFSHALLFDGESLHQVEARGLPVASDIADAETHFEFQLATAAGIDTIRAEILQPLRVAYLGTNQIGIGTHRGPDAHHDWVSCFTRFEWNGEVGYGSSERSIDLMSNGAV